MDAPILVLGARGKLGRDVVDQLRAAGAVTRCGTRDPGCCGHDCLGGDCARFDWDRPETFAPAVAGAAAVVVIARPLDATAGHVVPPLFDVCRDAGVARVVLVTAFGLGRDPAAPLHRAEALLRGANLAWTILRPNFFMENFSRGWFQPGIAGEGVIRAAAGDAATSFVSVADVAAVAVRALRESGHAGQAYDLTGGEPLTHAEAAAILARVLGRPVTYEDLPDHVLREGAAGAGLARSQVDYLADLYRRVREGACAAVTPDVARLLGRPPRSFADFARDEAAAWSALPSRVDSARAAP